MSYVKGVCKTTCNGKGRSNKHTKRFYVVYYYDESGNFHTKRIKRYEVPFYKMQICKQLTIFCTECEEKFSVLVKKNQQPICPKCLS